MQLYISHTYHVLISLRKDNFAELEKGPSYYPGQEDFLAGQNTSKAWFSLTHKHKDKDIHTHRMAYLTQFSIPALLNLI